MTKKQARQFGALKRRQRDVESYKKALEQGGWEDLFENISEKEFKSKLTKAQADVAVLSERLKDVFTEEKINEV